MAYDAGVNAHTVGCVAISEEAHQTHEVSAGTHAMQGVPLLAPKNAEREEAREQVSS